MLRLYRSDFPVVPKGEVKEVAARLRHIAGTK